MNVVLVDRCRGLRERIAKILTDVPGVCIAADVPTANEARAAIDALDPDAVVMDVHLEAGGGLELLQYLQARPHRPYVVVLANDPSVTHSARTQELADLCLDKAHDVQALCTVLERRAKDPSLDR